MSQHIQSTGNRGGARKGSGPKKKKDVAKITISVPKKQLIYLKEKGTINRSEAYSTAMDEWIKNIQLKCL